MAGMLLKVRTGNRKPEFGNEFTAVIHMRSQNGGKRKRTGDYFLTKRSSNSIVGGNMDGEYKIF